MNRYRLYVIRKPGIQYRHISIGVHRDTVTGEFSFFLSGFGHMLMAVFEKTIPDLISPDSSGGRFPRQWPCGIFAEKEFSEK